MSIIQMQIYVWIQIVTPDWLLGILSDRILDIYPKLHTHWTIPRATGNKGSFDHCNLKCFPLFANRYLAYKLKMVPMKVKIN